MNVKTTVVYNNLPKIAASLRPYANMVIRKTVADIETITKQSMAGPKSGREYPSRNRKMHRASAPGEPPAIDTGALVGSIQTKMVSDITGIVFTNSEYAAPLEFGSVKMAARPFFLPAAEQAYPAFLEAMKGIIRGG